MARGNAIIDIDVDPAAARADRRRALLRIGGPIFGVVLSTATILYIAIYASRANIRGALALSDDVLTALEGRITEQVTDYFGAAARTLAVGRSLTQEEPPGGRQALIEKFSIGALREVSQIYELVLGDSQGNFLLIRRGGNGGSETKTIATTPGQRTVVWTRRNAAGDVLARDEDPSDTFDPRTRPWYVQALTSHTISWTDVYLFYTGTEYEPGISASVRFSGIDDRTFVFSLNIALADLSNFLGGLKIGKSGRAMIVDQAGRIIAHPQVQRVVRRGVSGPETNRIDEIGDDVATGAYDRFRVEGPGRRTVTIGGKRYLATFTPLKATGQDWSLLIVAPENDFISFIGRTSRTGLFMSLVIVALTALGAAIVVRQGFRVDRTTRLVRDRERAIARQGAALGHLAEQADMFDPSQDHPPDVLTETAADISGARRASLWYLVQDGRLMHCADSFDREASVHSSGLEVERSELLRYFDHLTAGEEIDVIDAAGDPRTAEVHRLILTPLGTRALLSVPMRRRGKVVGAVWLEDPVDTVEPRQFLRVLASLAAFRGDRTSAPVRAHRLDHEASPAEPEAVHSRTAELSMRGLDATGLGDALYPEVCVLVVRVNDLACAAIEGAPDLINSVAQVMQEVAAEQEIPYLKLVGCDIVAAAGFTIGDPTAVVRIANTAVAGRDHLAALFEARGLGSEFRLGIDCGSGIGSAVGTDPRLFNLWGETPSTARTMADSAFAGAIQISEAIYLRLRQEFLFRPRGTFYLPGVGARQTFILAGRL